MAVSKRTRFEVLRRDNHTCRYCGQAAPDVKLTVDHVTPVALGGTDDPANLVTACAECGLTIDDILEAHTIACLSSCSVSKTSRYMAGIVNNWLREARARASEALREGH